ncbi:MAG: ubiquitin-like small modifier protein 1 [Frankiaceae bacterium]
MSVQVLLPGILADLAGGNRALTVDLPDGTLADLLDALAADHPLLTTRLRDETGALRRHVNVYVDGADVRGEQGLATGLRSGAVVQVLPSIAGGSSAAG